MLRIGSHGELCQGDAWPVWAVMERLVMAGYRGAVLERIGSVRLVAFGQLSNGEAGRGDAGRGKVRQSRSVLARYAIVWSCM